MKPFYCPFCGRTIEAEVDADGDVIDASDFTDGEDSGPLFIHDAVPHDPDYDLMPLH